MSIVNDSRTFETVNGLIRPAFAVLLGLDAALGMVQTFSALGNVGAGAISLGMVALLAHGVIATHWEPLSSDGRIEGYRVRLTWPRTGVTVPVT